MATGRDGGDLQFSESLGSEDLCGLVCQPCQLGGKLQEAVGLCTDCQEYLCQRCFEVHTLPTPTRNHKLLDKEQMLDSQISLERKDKCTEKCSVHRDKTIKYYCINHCILGCSVCMTLDHRSCANVRYIPHVAEDLANNNEYKQGEKLLESVVERSNSLTEDCKQKIESLETDCFETVKMVQEFRKEINETLKKIENHFVTTCETMKSEELKTIEMIKGQFKPTQKELHELIALKERYENNQQKCNLYIFMMKTKDQLKAVEMRIKEVTQSQSSINIRFYGNKETLSKLKNHEAFGILCKTEPPCVSRSEKTGSANALSSENTGTLSAVSSQKTGRPGNIGISSALNSEKTWRPSVLSPEKTWRLAGKISEKTGRSSALSSEKTGTAHVLSAEKTGISNALSSEKTGTSNALSSEKTGTSNAFSLEKTGTASALSSEKTETSSALSSGTKQNANELSSEKSRRPMTFSSEKTGTASALSSKKKRKQRTLSLEKTGKCSTSGSKKTETPDDLIVSPTVPVKDVNIKSKSDVVDCFITGIVVLPDSRLLVVDCYDGYFGNGNVKLVDVQHDKIITRLTLPSLPWDATMITNCQVAVTMLESKKIAFVNVTATTMSLNRTLDVNGDCHGVDYRDGRLAVSFVNPPKVQVLTLQGHVLHTITNEKAGNDLFIYPYYVVFGQDNTSLFVSNSINHNVLHVKFDGTVVGTYTDIFLSNPGALVALRNGDVYLCGLDSNNVHQFTADYRKLRLFVARDGGLINPSSIGFSEVESLLYVGLWSSNVVKVYSVVHGTR